jgi:hypothetical protein
MLPNVVTAIIDPGKITDYLLSRIYRRGAAKAAFFESFGFSLTAWPSLRDALLEHAKKNLVSATDHTDYGQSFEIVGRLTSPDGRNPFVMVVWFIREGENQPRLVTAFPTEDPTL